MRGALRGTLVYSIPLLGQRVVSVALLFVVTRVLSTEDFGILALLDQVNNILSVIFGAQFSSALGYYYHESQSTEQRARVVGTALGGALALGCIAALVSFPAAPWIARNIFKTDEAVRYLPLVFLSMPLNFFVEAVFGWLRVTDRQRAFAFGSLLRLGLTVVGIGVLVGILKLRVIAYLASNLAMLVVLVVTFGVYIVRVTPLGWSWTVFGRMLRFSMPLGLTWVAMFVVNFGDQVLLPQYRPLHEVGVYSLAYRIGLLVNMASGSFYSYWSAQVYQLLRREDGESVFATFATYYTLLVTFCGLALTLGARPGLQILIAPAFHAAGALIPILVLANAIRGLSEFWRTRFIAEGRPKYEAYCTWIGMAVCAALYLLLIPRYGMWGAAFASLLALAVMGVLSVVWTYRVRPYKVEGVRLAKIFVVAAAVVSLYFAVPVTPLLAQIGWSALTLALFPVGLWFLGFATPAERDVLSGLYGRFAVRRWSRSSAA